MSKPGFTSSIVSADTVLSWSITAPLKLFPHSKPQTEGWETGGPAAQFNPPGPSQVNPAVAVRRSGSQSVTRQ